MSIEISLYATDPVTREGAVAALSRYPQVRLTDENTAGTLLILAGKVDDALLDVMRCRHEASAGELSVVLVADAMRVYQILRAVDFGLVSLLERRVADFTAIVEAL